MIQMSTIFMNGLYLETISVWGALTLPKASELSPTFLKLHSLNPQEFGCALHVVVFCFVLCHQHSNSEIRRARSESHKLASITDLNHLNR